MTNFAIQPWDPASAEVVGDLNFVTLNRCGEEAISNVGRKFKVTTSGSSIFISKGALPRTGKYWFALKAGFEGPRETLVLRLANPKRAPDRVVGESQLEIELTYTNLYVRNGAGERSVRLDQNGRVHIGFYVDTTKREIVLFINQTRIATTYVGELVMELTTQLLAFQGAKIEFTTELTDSVIPIPGEHVLASLRQPVLQASGYVKSTSVSTYNGLRIAKDDIYLISEESVVPLAQLVEQPGIGWSSPHRQSVLIGHRELHLNSHLTIERTTAINTLFGNGSTIEDGHFVGTSFSGSVDTIHSVVLGDYGREHTDVNASVLIGARNVSTTDFVNDSTVVGDRITTDNRHLFNTTVVGAGIEIPKYDTRPQSFFSTIVGNEIGENAKGQNNVLVGYRLASNPLEAATTVIDSVVIGESLGEWDCKIQLSVILGQDNVNQKSMVSGTVVLGTSNLKRSIAYDAVVMGSGNLNSAQTSDAVVIGFGCQYATKARSIVVLGQNAVAWHDGQVVLGGVGQYQSSLNGYYIRTGRLDFTDYKDVTGARALIAKLKPRLARRNSFERYLPEQDVAAEFTHLTTTYSSFSDDEAVRQHDLFEDQLGVRKVNEVTRKAELAAHQDAVRNFEKSKATNLADSAYSFVLEGEALELALKDYGLELSTLKVRSNSEGVKTYELDPAQLTILLTQGFIDLDRHIQSQAFLDSLTTSVVAHMEQNLSNVLVNKVAAKVLEQMLKSRSR